MMPAPMTRSRGGTSANFSAPVEVTIFSSSISMPGRFAETEPEAMTIALVSMVWLSPLSGVTGPCPAPAIEPVPRNGRDLVLLEQVLDAADVGRDRLVLVLHHAAAG